MNVADSYSIARVERGDGFINGNDLAGNFVAKDALFIRLCVPNAVDVAPAQTYAMNS